MQRLNASNAEARFIKSILSNVFLPTMPTVRDGDYVVSGAEYCYKNNIIKCELSGVLRDGSFIEGITYLPRHGDGIMAPTVSEFCTVGKDFICGVGIRRATYKILSSIDCNIFEPGLNAAYVSHSDSYDVETHKQLGAYLRYYRDVQNIDLMSMYNCFCGETTSFFNITDSGIKDGNNDSCYVWLVPAQLNKEYTMYINSSQKVRICGVFVNSYGRIKCSESTNKYLDGLLDNKIITYDGMSYNMPAHYETFTNDVSLLSYNNNFYIAIQTSSREFPSIVVIEGDHRRDTGRFVTSADTYDYVLSRKTITDINGVKTTKENRYIPDFSKFSPPVHSSMTITPLSYHTPYASRLIEFLSESAISRVEDIPNNIVRIQRALNNRGKSLKEDDIWSDKLRFAIYNDYFKYTNKFYLKANQLTSKGYPIEKFPDDAEKYIVYDLAPPFEPGKYYSHDETNNTFTVLETKPENWDIQYDSYYEVDILLQDNLECEVMQSVKPLEINAKTRGTAKIFGLKNCHSKRDFDTEYDITGYVDKDVENSLFKYRSV